MPEISIVIPVYNLEKYIKKCLNSVLMQTFDNFEIICVNDGSTDSSLDILKEYATADKRIKIINQTNSGAGTARNNGLKHSAGKYVQFLDGDDYFEPQMLEKLYNLAEKHQSDITVCSSRKVDDEGNITETKNPNSPLNLAKLIFDKPFNYMDYKEDIFTLIGTIPWNKLYLREMLIKNDLKFPNLTGPDDLCFVHMSIVCAEKIVAIDDELINYRYNRQGSVQTYRANHTIDIIKAGLHIRAFLEGKGVYKKLEKAYLTSLIAAIRWETSLCNAEQYDRFIKELKILMPNDWKIFNSALRADYITPEYLKNFIGEQKVYLWGASIFIKEVLEKETNKNPNILGIIDRNEASWGKDFCGYKIYSPSILKENPANIVVTIYRNHEITYNTIKEDIEKDFFGINVLPNIFLGKKHG